MRARAFRSTVTVSELEARRLPFQTYIPFYPLTLAGGQQAALLSMHIDTHVRRGVASKLPRYSPSDFDALRNHDLCEKPEGYREHKLTPAGRIAAFTLEKELCKLHGIHVRRQGASHNYLNTVRCCCGWIGYTERNIHASHGAEVSFGKHLREVRSQQAVNVIRTALKPMPTAESA